MKAPTLSFLLPLLAILLTLGLVTPALAQDQINLNDGIINFHFNGAGTTKITMLIPAQYCSGGTCQLANGTASGTGDLQSSGTYIVSAPATNCDSNGNCDGPFYLTVNADGSSTVTQTEPIQFTYTSQQGTLTGLLEFSTVSATNSHLQSTMLGTLTVTGGTFASYFPAGGNVNIVLGLTFPLQILWKVHGFSAAEFLNGTISPTAVCVQPSSNSSNFNGTAIPGGDYIWFNANFAISGSVKDGTTLNLTQANVAFTADGVKYSLPAPNAVVTFSASASCISTTFDNNTQTFHTIVPLSGSDEIFLDGLAYPVPSGGLPGGINPIVWTGNFSSNASGLSIQWKWGAAVYTQFSTDYNAIGVKPSHTNACAYNNSDHAGTPENFKNYVIGGARGGGGSNWTGSWSGTVQVQMTCN
jgi:hypothetical protein